MRWSNNCCTVIECLSHFTGCKYWQCKSESVPQYCIQFWILRNANILSADRTQCSSTFCRTLLYLDSCTLVSWDLSYVLLSTLPLWECEAVLMLYLECRVLCCYPPYLCESVRQCSCCILSAEYCATIHLTSVRVWGSAHAVSWVPSTAPLWGPVRCPAQTATATRSWPVHKNVLSLFRLIWQFCTVILPPARIHCEARVSFVLASCRNLKPNSTLL